MDKTKITAFVEQSKAVIADLQKTAADQTAELSKVAEAKTAETATLKKLAAETANHLLQQKIIAAADLQKFAEGLAEPGAAHNMIRNLTIKLASAQAPVRLGRPSQQKTASADDGKLDANAIWDQRLQAATGRG